MGNRDIIVMGGSSGCLEALKSVFANLSLTLPASVLVVRHIAADGDDLLAPILAGIGSLPVQTATECDVIQPGRAYVAPAGRHLLVNDGRVLLGRGPKENMARPAVDALFRSAALEYGSRVIGVVLSGTLDDGAAGLEAISRCGGVTVIQDPLDSTASAMPLAALEACDVDYRFTTAKLAAGLVELTKEIAPPTPPPPNELQLEVQIAAGRPCTTDVLMRIAAPVALSCPACSGVLSQMRDPSRLRFRCQIGHAYSAEALDEAQDASVSEAIGVAIRVLEERHTLLTKMAADAERRGHRSSAVQFAGRAVGYREQADVLRRALSDDMP
jgi:two-component system chemotaxis response regulator CheB